MRFRWSLAGLAGAVGVALLATLTLLPDVEATGRRGFSERDLRGTYNAFFEGEATEGPFTGHATAIGLVRFDGRGNYVVHRTVNIGGTLIVNQIGDCTYSVEPSGSGTARCVVSTPSPPGIPDMIEDLAFTLTEADEAYFMSITPGLSAVGTARKQTRPGRR